jgi:pantetheine-phosphate adenylyltransferase
MPIAIYPGTFDPIHFGHIDIVARAAALFSRLIVAVYDRPSKLLTFTTEERVQMCREALSALRNVEVLPYSGLTVEFARKHKARAIVRGLRVISDFEHEFRMALTNKTLAPEIEYVCFMTSSEYAHISSSILKEVAALGADITGMAPPHVQAALKARFGGDGDNTLQLASMLTPNE